MNHKFPGCRKSIDEGPYNAMDDLSPEDDRRPGETGTGPHPDGAPDLVVLDGPIPTLASPPPAEAEPQLAAPVAPEPEPGFIEAVANRPVGSSTFTRPGPPAG